MKPTLTDPALRTYLDSAYWTGVLAASCRNASAPGSELACLALKGAGCDKDSDEPCDFTKSNPWRAPGHAGLDSPCGLAGGGAVMDLQTGCEPPMVAGKVQKMGTPGEDLAVFKRTEWQAGSVQEVSWGFNANHGGGYAYRLCPASEEPTEACFQKHHLQFVNNQTWLQKRGNKNKRTAFKATPVSEGTSPPGSIWMKNPIPPCDGPYGGAQYCMPAVEGGPPSCDCSKPQWEPPLPGLFGFGIGHCAFPDPRTPSGVNSKCSVKELAALERTFLGNNYVDQVQVPADLPPGDYVISFRWDCEQTPQIWATCGDIKITA